jgi:VWFA-related protein
VGDGRYMLKSSVAAKAWRALALMLPVCLCCGLLAFAGSRARHATTQSPAAAQKSAPAIRVATRLIQVNVIVDDKKGEPVSGLAKDDFTLLDQSQSQKIAFFSEETDRPRVAAPATPPPADVFSNQLEAQPGAPTSVTVILLDSLNTGFLEMGFARERVVKFLHQVHPQDRVALYALSEKLLILHDFTQDAGVLLRALDGYKNKGNAEFSASDFTMENRGSADVNLSVNLEKLFGGRAISDFNTVDRVHATAAALEAIADHLAALPGRKNLVWVSGSFPINIGSLPRRGMATRSQNFTATKDIEAAARALNNANLAIYPVDARGIIVDTGLSDDYLYGRKTASGLPTRGAGVALDPPQENFTTMDDLAEATGGHAFYNANDLDVSIRRAIDDSRDTYVLSYYPAMAQWDGSFHEIKVEVKQPGVQVRSRRGYYAFPDTTPDANRQTQQMADAVSAPLESTALGLTVQADPVEAPGPRKLKIHIRVDSARMLFQQKDGRWMDRLDLVWAQIGTDGRTLVSSSEGLNLHMSPETYATTEREGLKVSTALDLRDDTAALRLVARDAGTGAIGSLNIPLDNLFAPKPPAVPPVRQEPPE